MDEEKKIISIIIPAHNEENVILRCLNNLLNNIDFVNFEVFVVCNGCSDQTAVLVRNNHREVNVIEIGEASKIKALNTGDDYATGFPRVYIDADIIIDGSSLKILIEEMEQNSLLAASPEIKVELEGRSWIVKQFYKIWCISPYVTNGTIGSGVYALSKKGREKFNQFPEIIADDGFVRSLFSPDERGVVSGASFIVFPPMHLMDLLKIKIRVRTGIYEVKHKFPKLVKKNHKKEKINTMTIIKDISLWPSFFIYSIINIAIRLGAFYKYYFGNRQFWSRDNSSRI